MTEYCHYYQVKRAAEKLCDSEILCEAGDSAERPVFDQRRCGRPFAGRLFSAPNPCGSPISAYPWRERCARARGSREARPLPVGASSVLRGVSYAGLPALLRGLPRAPLRRVRRPLPPPRRLIDRAGLS